MTRERLRNLGYQQITVTNADGGQEPRWVILDEGSSEAAAPASSAEPAQLYLVTDSDEAPGSDHPDEVPELDLQDDELEIQPTLPSPDTAPALDEPSGSTAKARGGRRATRPAGRSHPAKVEPERPVDAADEFDEEPSIWS